MKVESRHTKNVGLGEQTVERRQAVQVASFGLNVVVWTQREKESIVWSDVKLSGE